MKSRRQSGDIDIWLILFIFVTIFFIGAVSFGVWAFSSRQDYKDNSDAKAAAAVKIAVEKEDVKKNNEFAEAAKNPFRTYVGPEPYGTLHVMYPKTWSAYVDTDGTGNIPVDGYFQPDTVPSVSDQKSSFALRVQISPSSYSSTLNNYNNLVKANLVKVSPFSFPKVSSAIGVRVDGQVDGNKQGSMVLVPLRDKTLKVWITATQYMDDFNNNILPNLTFQP